MYRGNSARFIAGLSRSAFFSVIFFLISSPLLHTSKANGQSFNLKMDSSAQARFDLIRENLGEILNPELIESILAEGRNPRVYWGKIIPSRYLDGQII